MKNKVLKAFIRDRYDIKVKRIGLSGLYYTKSYNYDSQGGYYDYTTTCDDFGDVLANKLFPQVSDILVALKNSKDYKGEELDHILE